MSEYPSRLVEIIYHKSGVKLSTAERIAKAIEKAGYLPVELVQQQIASMEVRIADMKADRLTYCAYCGEEFPIDADGTPEAVSNHIHNCPKHPIQDYKVEIEQLKEQLAKFVPVTQETNVHNEAKGQLYRIRE